MPRCLLVFEPPDGGVPEHVMRLALGLRGHGWQPWVAGPQSSILDPALAGAGIPRSRLPLKRGFGAPASDAASLRRLTGILLRERFDLVHAHSAKGGIIARLAALVATTPVVYSPHCFPFVGPWGPLRFGFSLTVERALGRATDAIICVAESERRLALAHRVGKASRLHVVHNGADCANGGLEPDRELESFAADGPLAACIAVLRPQKAVHVFVEAAPHILRRLPEARLAVIGNGALREDLERQARELGLDDRFRFFDFQPPASRQLRSTDVFVLSSAWEAFPIGVLEAMACGVPQVATDVGGTSEAVAEGETGLLCPPDQPEALADRVGRLLADPGWRARMADASIRRHRLQFAVEDMVRRTAAVYDEVMARRTA